MILVSLLLFQAVWGDEYIMLSEGDHFTKILDEDLKDVQYNQCNGGISVEIKTNQTLTQELHFQDVVQVQTLIPTKVIYYPSEFNIVLMLERSGNLVILYTEDQTKQNEFKVHNTLNLNSRGLQDFICTDITQATVSDFYAICRGDQVYIASITCDYNSFDCKSELYPLESMDLVCNEYSIITETTWRQRNPLYFAVYCYSAYGVPEASSIYLFHFHQGDPFWGGILDLPMQHIQKVSFFDSLTLMVLDRERGLFVIKIYYTEEENIFDYHILLQQLFLQYEQEQYFTMGYSLEQSAIRFPPSGVDENDINYSIVIITNLHLYEIVLPTNSQQFFNLKLPINDKISLQNRSYLIKKGEKLKTAEVQYDELFYYVCLSSELHTECLRIRRHSFGQYQTKTLLQSKNPFGQLLTYPVSYSPIVGQTNLIILQQLMEKVQLTLIRNEVERVTITQGIRTKDECIIKLVYSEKNTESIHIISEVLNTPTLYQIPNNYTFTFPNTEAVVNVGSILMGPDPQLQKTDSDKDNVEVSQFSGIMFPVPEEYQKEYVDSSKISPPRSFNDNEFWVTFTQTDKIYLLLTQEQQISQSFQVEVHPSECNIDGEIKDIVGISPYYFIFYKGSSQIIRFKVQRASQYKISGELFSSQCDILQLPVLTSVPDYSVLADVNFQNLFIITQPTIFFTDIDCKSLYQINTKTLYRQLNIQFIKNNLLIGSFGNELYLIELLNPYNSEQLNINERKINLGLQLSANFTFFIVYIKDPIPYLVIVDTIITIFKINNLQFDVSFDTTVPTFGHKVEPETVWLNYNTLIVTLNQPSDFLIYDLSMTGSDRLMLYKTDWIDKVKMQVSYPKNEKFKFCISNKTAFISCYFEKKLFFQLRYSDPKNIDNNFNVNIQGTSTLGSIQKVSFQIKGSFTYQDTVISINQSQDIFAIYKTNSISQIQTSNYFSGPIFKYSLAGDHKNQFKIHSYISCGSNDSVKIDLNQTVLGATASREYLIITGQDKIQILNILKTQYIKAPSITVIDHSEINDVFFANDQPMIMFCSKSFINMLSNAMLIQIHIIAFVCQTVMEGVFQSNEINQLSFAIVQDQLPLKDQILKNMFFLRVTDQEYIYQKRSSLILDAVEMINYPISLSSYRFVTVTALVKQNKIYSSNDSKRDQIICIIVGQYNQQESNFLEGFLIDQIGSQLFSKDTLIVNNFQIACLLNCTLIEDKAGGNYILNQTYEIIFNDQYYFKLYRIRFTIYFETKMQQRSQVLYGITQSSYYDLKENLKNSEIQASNYIDTIVQKQEQSAGVWYTINVTTDGLSYDLVLGEIPRLQLGSAEESSLSAGDASLKIEQVFKQYTQCKSPSGSLTASFKEFFVMSCKNVSEKLDEQKQYVKLFIRQSSQNVSVVEAIELEGELFLIDINENGRNVQLMLLEMVDQSFFNLQWYSLQSQFQLEALADAEQENYPIKLCATNLKASENESCAEVIISNIGYGQYEFRETLLFVLLLLLPLLLSVSCIIYGISKYKKEKQNRQETFQRWMEEQKCLTNETVQRQ